MPYDNYRKHEPFFGSWYIKDKIGEGAYGKVFLIERHELGAVYRSAMKVMTIPQDKGEIQSIMSDGMSMQEATEYFRNVVDSIVNEFILMSRLKGNSNIVSYEDHMIIEHEDDIGWDILIRMELLTPLISYTADRTMCIEEIFKLGIDMCKALEFCRRIDVIHRDIKPENIFIAPSGDYKLGDFGIAKTVEKTRVGLSRKGTYPYMAPEVYKGEAYGPTVDVYSLGIVLYKLLNNNRTPFMPPYPEQITYDDREEALIKRIKGEQIPPPDKGSQGLKQAILKACAFAPEDRYQSASEFRADLEMLQTNPNAVIKASVSGHISKKKIIAAAIVAAILACIGTVYGLIPKAPEDISGIGPDETMYIGDSLKPEYTVTPSRFSDEQVICTSSDESIVTVDSDGTITAIAAGTAELELAAAGYSETVQIKVVPKITDIRGIDDEISLVEGNSVKVSPELLPAEFSDERITYSIEDTSMASVSDNGTLTGISPGTTVLTVSAGGYSEDYSVVIYNYVAPKQTTPSTKSSTTKESSESSGSSSGESFGDEEFF